MGVVKRGEVRIASFVVGALWLVACGMDRPPASIGPADREPAARQLLAGVQVTATVERTTLLAAGVSADFGIEEGVRRVTIRVIDTLDLDLRLQAEHDVVLEGSPRICLVGPFWNPLDAGLSDYCWGDAEQMAALAEELPTDGAGHPSLPAGEAVDLAATVARGRERCDYAPGEWHLEIRANPIVDGSPVGPLDLPDVIVNVPFVSGDVLELLPPGDTRVCSYPAAVVMRQGEPSIRPSDR